MRVTEIPDRVDYSALAIPGGEYAKNFDDEFTKYFGKF